MSVPIGPLHTLYSVAGTPHSVRSGTANSCMNSVKMTFKLVKICPMCSLHLNNPPHHPCRGRLCADGHGVT